MTWTKLGDRFFSDERLVSLPRGVRLLHLEAMVWSNLRNTDGRIPAHMLAKITDQPRPPVAAALLVESGLWATDPAGWTLKEFLQDQPSAHDVEHQRVQLAVRQRRQRQHKTGDHSLCNPDYCRSAAAKAAAQVNGNTEAEITRSNDRDDARDKRVSHDVRHDPTRPGTEERRDGEGRGVAGLPLAGARSDLPAPPVRMRKRTEDWGASR